MYSHTNKHNIFTQGEVNISVPLNATHNLIYTFIYSLDAHVNSRGELFVFTRASDTSINGCVLLNPELGARFGHKKALRKYITKKSRRIVCPSRDLFQSASKAPRWRFISLRHPSLAHARTWRCAAAAPSTGEAVLEKNRN